MQWGVENESKARSEYIDLKQIFSENFKVEETGLRLCETHFLVYITDIVEEIQSNINSFADDSCLSMIVGNPSAAGTILQNDINKIIPMSM